MYATVSHDLASLSLVSMTSRALALSFSSGLTATAESNAPAGKTSPLQSPKPILKPSPWQ